MATAVAVTPGLAVAGSASSAGTAAVVEPVGEAAAVVSMAGGDAAAGDSMACAVSTAALGDAACAADAGEPAAGLKGEAVVDVGDLAAIVTPGLDLVGVVDPLPRTTGAR